MSAPHPAPAAALTREQALAKAQANLKAKARRDRRKSSLVLGVSGLALLLPAALFAGMDLSGWLYPAPPPEAASAPLEAAPEGVVGMGSHVTLAVEGALSNGTVFLPNGTLEATIGSGDLVPGLDRAMVGLKQGDAFDVVVAPQDGYGNWSSGRTSHQSPTEQVKRNTTMEVGNFDDRWGTPHVGQVAPTKVWPSVVVSIGSKYVNLQYQAAVGETVRYHKYWDSRVTAVNNTTITLDNLLWIGYTYNRTTDSGAVLTYVVTKIDSRGYLLDRNAPLAGQALHFRGVVVATVGGAQGAAPPVAAAAVTGRPVNLGTQDCSRCHGAFRPVSARAVAVVDGTRVRVDVALGDPWKHEVTNLTVAATEVEANATLATDVQPAPDLTASGTETLTLTLPETPTTDGAVRVVVNATARHTHRSPGRHDSNPYQLTIEIPISGPGSAPGAGPTLELPPPALPAAQTPAEIWGLLGQWAGAVALASVFLPATQGLRRHAGAKPLFRVPQWVTAHFTMSVAVILASAFHAVALMSSTYHGVWTWDVWAGVAGLAALGCLGATGVILAKWTPARWKGAKRIHYYLLTAFIFAGVLHILASSTTLRWLMGV